MDATNESLDFWQKIGAKLDQESIDAGGGSNFVLTKEDFYDATSSKTKSQLTDIWNKATKPTTRTTSLPELLSKVAKPVLETSQTVRKVEAEVSQTRQKVDSGISSLPKDIITKPPTPTAKNTTSIVEDWRGEFKLHDETRNQIHPV